MTMNDAPLEINDFELDTWLNNEPELPGWLRSGVETLYFETFEELVIECRQKIQSANAPEKFGVADYQVHTADVTNRLGRSRSAIRKERYGKLVEHFENTNSMLLYYWKKKVGCNATASSYKNKPDLQEENRLLKEEIKKLKNLSHRTFLNQMIIDTDNANVQDKIGRVSILSERNKELELQVARLSMQLRNTWNY